MAQQNEADRFHCHGLEIIELLLLQLLLLLLVFA